MSPAVDLYALGLTLSECLGDEVEAEWERLIVKLTHYKPARRGDATSLLRALGGSGPKYHLLRRGAEPEGPLSVDAVITALLDKAEGAQLWWPAASGRPPWGEVGEVRGAWRWLRGGRYSAVMAR